MPIRTRLVVFTIFTQVVRPSVPKLQYQAKITAGGLTWIIDDSCLVILYFQSSLRELEKKMRLENDKYEELMIDLALLKKSASTAATAAAVTTASTTATSAINPLESKGRPTILDYALKNCYSDFQRVASHNFL